MEPDKRRELMARLTQYESFLAADPGNARLALECADLQWQLGDLPKAREQVHQGLLSNPGHHGLTYLLSSVEMAAGQPAVAVSLLRSLLGNGVDTGRVRYNLAYALALEQRMQEAREVLCEKQALVFADYPPARVLLAQVHHHLAELDDAMNCLGEFLRENPAHGEANACLALVHADREEYPQAREAAQKSLDLSDHSAPHQAIAHLAMGLVELEDSEADRALAHFRQASALKGDNSGRAWIGAGLSHLLRGELAEGEEALVRGLELMPSHLGSWNALAWTRISRQKLVEAEQALMQAMEINRNFSETHGTLAVVQFLKGDLEAARQSVRRARGLDGDSYAAAYAESLLAAQSGDAEGARKKLEALFSRSLNDQGKTLESEIRKFALKRQNESQQKQGPR